MTALLNFLNLALMANLIVMYIVIFIKSMKKSNAEQTQVSFMQFSHFFIIKVITISSSFYGKWPDSQLPGLSP